jgi:ParB family chromosome partitioning protein
MARRVVKEGLSVRQTESLISEVHQKQTAKQEAEVHPVIRNEKDVHVAHMEQQLVEKFNTKVRLKYVEGKGSLEIRFFSDDELERILSDLGVSADE